MMQLAPMDAAPAALAPIENTAPLATTTTTTEEENNQNTADNNNNNNTNATTNATDFSPRENDNSTSNILPAPNNNDGTFFDESPTNIHPENSTNKKNVQDAGSFDVKIPTANLDDDQAETDSNKKGRGNSEDSADNNNNNDEDLEKNKPSQDELDKQQQEENDGKKKNVINADGTFTIGGGDDADMVLDDFAAFNDNKAPIEIVVDRGRMDIMRPVLEVPHSSYRILFVDPTNRLDVVGDHGYMAIKRAGWTRTQANQYWIPSAMRKDFQAQQLQRLGNKHGVGGSSHQAGSSNGMQQAASNGLLQSNSNSTSQGIFQPQQIGGNKMLNMSNSSSAGHHHQFQNQNQQQALDSQTLVNPATGRNADTPPPMLTFDAIANPDGQVTVKIPEYGEGEYEEDDGADLERASDQTQKGGELDRVSSNKNNNKQQPISALGYLSKASENIGHVDPTCQRFFRPLGYLTRDFVFFEDAMFEEDFFSLETILGQDGEKDEFDITEMAGVTRLQPTAVEPADSELRTYDVPSFVLDALRKANGTDADPFVPPSTYKEYNPLDDDDDEEALGRYVSAAQEEHEAKKRKIEEEKRKIEDEKKKAQALALKKQQEEQERKEEEERKRRQQEKEREEAEAEAARKKAEEDAKDPLKRKKALLKTLNRFKLDYAKTHNGDKPSAALMKVDPEIGPVYKEYLQLKKMLKKQEGGAGGGEKDSDGSGGSDAEEGKSTANNNNKPGTPQAASVRPTTVHDQPVTPQSRMKLGGLDDVENDANAPDQDDDPNRVHTTKTVGNNKLDKNEKRYYRNLLKQLRDWKHEFFITRGIEPTRGDMITDHKVSGIILELRKQFGKDEDITISDDEDEMPNDLLARKKWCARKLNQWKQDFAAARGRQPTGKDIKSDGSISKVYEIYKSLKDMDDAALSGKNADNTPESGATPGASVTPQASTTPQVTSMAAAAGSPLGRSGGLMPLDGTGTGGGSGLAPLDSTSPSPAHAAGASTHKTEEEIQQEQIQQQHKEMGPLELARRRKQLGLELNRWRAAFLQLNGRKPTSRDVNADPHIKQVYKEYSAIPTDVGANEAANRRQDLAQQLNDWKSLFAQKNGRKPTSDDIQGDEAMAHAYLEYNDLAKEGDETSKEQEKEMLQAPSEVGGARLPLVAGSLEQDMAEEEKKEKEAARRTSRKHELSVQLNAFKTAFVQRNGRKAKESDFLDDDDIRDAYEEFMRLKKQDDEIAAAEAKAAEELEKFQRERDRHQEVVRLLNDWKKQYQMKNGKKPTKSDIENDDEIKEIYQEFVDFQNKKKEQEEHIQHQQQEAEGTSRIQATTVISHHHHAGGDGEDDNATAAVSQDQQQQQQQQEDTESRKKFLLGKLNAWKTEFKNQHGKGPTAKNIKADPEMAAIFQEYNALKKQGGGGGGDDDDASSPSAKKENGDDDNNENEASSPSTTNQQQQEAEQGEEETPAQKKKRVTSELNKWKSNFKSQHGKNPTVKDIKADPTILPIYEAYLSFKNTGGDDAASPSKGDNDDDQQQQQQETTQAATPAAALTTASTSEQQQAEEESVEDKKKRLLAQLNTWKANFKEQHDGKGPSASDMKADESIYPVFQEYQALKSGGDTTNEEQPTETSDEAQQQQTEEAAPTAAAISSEQPTITTATTDEANTTTAQAQQEEEQQEESIEDKKKRLVAQLNKWKADFHETHGKKPSGKDLQADDSIRPVFEEYQALKKLSTSHNEKDDDQEEQQQPPATASDAPLQQDATAAPVVDEKSPTEEAPEAGATATEQEQESVEDEKKRLVAQLNKWKADYLATHGKKPSGKDLQADDSIRPVFERYQELKKSGGEEKEEEDEQQVAKKKAEEEEEQAAAAAAAAEAEAEAAAAKQKAEQEEQERLKKEQEEKEEQERVAAAEAAAAEAAAQEEAEKKRLAEEQEAAEAEAKKKKQAEEEVEQQRLAAEAAAAEAAAAEAAAEKERLEREEQERLKKEQEEKEAAAAAAEEAEAAAKLKVEQEEQERLKKEQEEQEAATAAAAAASAAAATAAASSSETNVEDRKKELAQKLNAFKKDFKAKNDRNPTADDINADPEIKPIFDEYQLLKKGGDSSPAPKTETETDTATAAAPQQQQAETPAAAAAAEPSTPAREASNVEDRKKELAQRLNVFKKEFKAKNDRNPTADDINADPEIKPLFDEYQLLKKGGDATSASPAAVTAEASPAPAPSSSSEQHQQHQEQTPAPTTSSETNVEDRKKELAQKLNAFKKEFKAKHDRNPTAEDINADPEIKPIFDEYQLLKKGGEAPTTAPAPAESESTPAPVAASAAETPTTTGADVEERKKELAQKLNAFKKDFKAKNDRNPTADDINADPEIKPIFDEYQLLKKGGDSSPGAPAPKTETPAAAAAASSSSTNQAAETSTNINNNSNDTEDRKKHLARQLNAWKTEFKSKNGKGPTADDINADAEIKAVFDEYQAMKKSESSSNSATATEQQQQQEQDNVKTASTTEAPDSATATTSVVAGSGGGDVEERKKELARRLNAFKKEFKEKNERGPTMDDIKADAEIAAVFKEYEELKKQVQ